VDLILTFDTRPALLDIARGVATRFAESAGCPSSRARQLAGAVATLLAEAGAGHPAAECQATLHLRAEPGRVEVVVSYPAGSLSPGATWNGRQVAARVGRDTDEATCWTEDGTRYCRLICRGEDGST